MKNYEIYNLTTGELLADKLTFNEVPELFDAYMNFFPEDEITVCYRESIISTTYPKIINKEEMSRQAFTREWMNLMDELVIMDNIY